MLKIYTYDLGYRGGLVITAHSKQEAHEKLMERSAEYNFAIEDAGSNEELEEHELEGFFNDFYGDR